MNLSTQEIKDLIDSLLESIDHMADAQDEMNEERFVRFSALVDKLSLF